MKSAIYRIVVVGRGFLAARRLPLCLAAIFAALMAFSYIAFGSVSPPGPQVSGNAAYQTLWRGDVAGAVNGFEGALEADPAFPYRWSDLGESLADAGRMEEARYCFRRALELAPGSPQVELRAANFSFRAGSVAEALSADSLVLGQTAEFDQMIFRSWIRLAGGIGRVLDTGVGTNARAARGFFDFLIADGDRADTYETWRWLESRGYVASRQGREWANLLLASNLAADAAGVWASHVAVDPDAYRKSSWIDNGGFESDWPGGAFDWNSVPCPGVTVTADNTVAHGGARSLRLDVNSEDNLDFHHFFQRTWMPPGRYRLEGWVRTRGFTTDRGIGLQASEPGLEAQLDAFTATVTGDSDWTRISRDFAITGRPAMVEIRIVRPRSWAFDNHPRGAAWIDDVRVQPLP